MIVSHHSGLVVQFKRYSQGNLNAQTTENFRRGTSDEHTKGTKSVGQDMIVFNTSLYIFGGEEQHAPRHEQGLHTTIIAIAERGTTTDLETSPQTNIPKNGTTRTAQWCWWRKYKCGHVEVNPFAPPSPRAWLCRYPRIADLDRQFLGIHSNHST